MNYLQYLPSLNKENCLSNYDSLSKIRYYLNPDSLPVFPGGFMEMEKFILFNARFNFDIDANGKIIFEFIVDQDGEISNLKILRRLVDEWDFELIRVVKLMPKWKPGICNGNKVPIKMEFSYSIMLR